MRIRTFLARKIALILAASFCIAATSACFVAAAFGGDDDHRLSHQPPRPLPKPSDRPLGNGRHYFVDPGQGRDENDGQKGTPWRTIAHALPRLRAGDTLVLRAGVYAERLKASLQGERDKPITIRGAPGELAIIDAGIPEFRLDPAGSWRPVDDSPGEYVSTRSFPDIGVDGVILGHFEDSLIPLHGYRYLTDLLSHNEFWTLSDKLAADQSIYCGPGIWYDGKSGRIHCRLAPTTLGILGEDNYDGPDDPRKLPLVVARGGSALELNDSTFVQLQDFVIRGASGATARLSRCREMRLEGLHVLGGSPVMLWTDVDGLVMSRCALRGVSAPWSFRGNHKYRGTAAYLLTARGDAGEVKRVEIDHCELTDSHDGPFVGAIRGLRLHHSLIDNFNDDGIYSSFQKFCHTSFN